MATYNIGDSVTLNGKVYLISSKKKKSFIITTGGKDYKATASKMDKIIGQNKSRTETSRDSQYFLKSRLKLDLLFNDKAKLPETEDELLKAMSRIECDMSPENLMCDGEASKDEVSIQEAKLRGEWKEIENLLGRKVKMSS